MQITSNIQIPNFETDMDLEEAELPMEVEKPNPSFDQQLDSEWFNRFANTQHLIVSEVSDAANPHLDIVKMADQIMQKKLFDLMQMNQVGGIQQINGDERALVFQLGRTLEKIKKDGESAISDLRRGNAFDTVTRWAKKPQEMLTNFVANQQKIKEKIDKVVEIQRIFSSITSTIEAYVAQINVLINNPQYPFQFPVLTTECLNSLFQTILHPEGMENGDYVDLDSIQRNMNCIQKLKTVSKMFKNETDIWEKKLFATHADKYLPAYSFGRMVRLTKRIGLDFCLFHHGIHQSNIYDDWRKILDAIGRTCPTIRELRLKVSPNTDRLTEWNTSYAYQIPSSEKIGKARNNVFLTLGNIFHNINIQKLITLELGLPNLKSLYVEYTIRAYDTGTYAPPFGHRVFTILNKPMPKFQTFDSIEKAKECYNDRPEEYEDDDEVFNYLNKTLECERSILEELTIVNSVITNQTVMDLMQRHSLKRITLKSNHYLTHELLKAPGNEKLVIEDCSRLDPTLILDLGLNTIDDQLGGI